jgi:ceramide glucosyltransferase
LVLYAIQWGSSRRHLREVAPVAKELPPISILKPLCGLDDDLEKNLICFASLDYPRYELLLGVRSTKDAAYPLALRVARKFPHVRVVLQRGEPGLNPKVNQLVTLAAAARHEILVVSDSNVRVENAYLRGIASAFEDPEVGLVTHPIVGVGEARMGSLCDNMHLATSVAAGMVGAKRVAKKDVVVGKSMALRRRDLEALGGFHVVVNVLAEDYVMGKMISQQLKKRVAMAHSTVENVSRDRSLGDFYRRYRRWAVIHHQAIGTRVYAAQILLNPSVVALAAFAMHPTAISLAGFGAVSTLKVGYDLMTLRLFRAGPIPLRAPAASLVKDAVLGAAWLHGLFRREVEWRSNRLRVLPGTRLQPTDHGHVMSTSTELRDAA